MFRDIPTNNKYHYIEKKNSQDYFLSLMIFRTIYVKNSSANSTPSFRTTYEYKWNLMHQAKQLIYIQKRFKRNLDSLP